MGNPMTKTLHNTDLDAAKKNVSDLIVTGNGDLFKLLAKASSEQEGWMKSTKAMQIWDHQRDEPMGAVVQVTTQQRNPDGTYAVAEALCYVPGMRVSDFRGWAT